MSRIMKSLAAYLARFKKQPPVETPSAVDAIVRLLKEKQEVREKERAQRG